MVYIVNCDELKFFKTFIEFDSVIDYLKSINNSDFNGDSFSLFGRGQKEVYNGEDYVWVDDSYYIDSVVLSPKSNINKYYTFFIRRIDSKGNLVELN